MRLKSVIKLLVPGVSNLRRSLFFARVFLFQIKVPVSVWRLKFESKCFSEKDLPSLFINALAEMDCKISMSYCWLLERFRGVGQVVLNRLTRKELGYWNTALEGMHLPLGECIGHCLLGNTGSWIRETVERGGWSGTKDKLCHSSGGHLPESSLKLQLMKNCFLETEEFRYFVLFCFLKCN